MQKDKQIRVLIADDHPVFRRGMKSVIDSEVDLKIVAEAGNGDEALLLIESESPDIVILDVDMPGKDGIETARAIDSQFPGVKVLFLTLHKDREILNALTTLNVLGYILKDSALSEVVDCIRLVWKGETYVSPAVAQLAHSPQFGTYRQITTVSAIENLSSTEMVILRYVAESMSNRDIAAKMFISVRTVENHRFNICSKLKIGGSSALLKFAIANRNKILDLPLYK